MNNIAILHLSLIDGVGPYAVKLLLDQQDKIKIQDFYNLNISDFKNLFRFSDRLANKTFEGLKNKLILEKELELIEKHKINWCCIIDESYPYLLKNIYCPPTVLFWKGRELENSDKNIAIIGSRKANFYAQKTINNLVQTLINNNWNIVSGGAIGADTMAHKASLNFFGKTIVVLGSGLLKPYPSSNNKLFEEILSKSGTLLSSFPLNTDALPGNFPSRNRIISGISKGCIVIQAALKSGTRITALHAIEQGREVFAIPGPIDDELSQGCNKLIQEGAKLVSSPEDILKEFNEISSQKVTNSQDHDDGIESFLDYSNPISIDELIQKTGLELNDLQNMLFELQLEGKIKQNFAGLWQKIC